MERIDLKTAIREIVQSSEGTYHKTDSDKTDWKDDQPSPIRGQQPFFFIVGAGVSFPSIPLASEIIKACRVKAVDDGCDAG